MRTLPLLACLALGACTVPPRIVAQTPAMVQVDWAAADVGAATTLAQQACQQHGRNAILRREVNRGSDALPAISRTYECVPA